MTERTPAGDKGTADRIEADDGGYWCRLVTRQALDREGACMDHCVGEGGYDKLVGGEDLTDDSIWSLRDRGGMSILTVRIWIGEVDLAKGPSNHEPGRGASMQVRHLVAAFKAAGHALEVSEAQTDIVLLEDGRTFRRDRLPPEVRARMQTEAEERALTREERRFQAYWRMRNPRIEGGYLVVERNGETLQLAEVASHFAHTPEPVTDGPVAGVAMDDGLVTIRFPGGRRVNVMATAVVRVPGSDELVPFRGDLRPVEGPLRPMVDSWAAMPAGHDVFSLTADEPDPVVRAWTTFDTGHLTFITQSGIRFTVPHDIYVTVEERVQATLERYRAAVLAAAAEPQPAAAFAPDNPRLGLLTRIVSGVEAGTWVDLVDPIDGSVYNVTDVAVRGADGQLLTHGVDYAVEAAAGMVLILRAQERVEIEFRAGPQPQGYRVLQDHTFTMVPLSEAIEAARHLAPADTYLPMFEEGPANGGRALGNFITLEDLARARAFSPLRLGAGPGGGGGTP